MAIKYKEIVSNRMQESFNLDLVLSLNSRGVDFHSLSSTKKHLALNKMISICNKCNVSRKGFMPTKYHQSPDLVIIGRSNTSSDLKYTDMLNNTIPAVSILSELCNSLGYAINDSYYTNISLCTVKTVNDVTVSMCNRCFLYKDMELDTIDLPDVFLLLGNDAMNSFYDLSCSVNHILGDIFISKYKGRNRLFIPVPHPAYLLRDKNLRVVTNKMLSSIRLAIEKGFLISLNRGD